ncbi:MAG: FkbM family methyltransferase [Woeseiaceae bacterium]
MTDFDGDLMARLALDERMQSQIFWFGYCNRDICAVLRRILKKGMTVIDAGANIGEVTLVAAKAVGPEGMVFAFEPVGRIADHLANHVRMNGLSQVSTIRCALADKVDRKPIFKAAERFYDGSIHDGLGTLFSSAQRSVATEEVLLTTLDVFVREANVQRLDLIKLDVEGAELAALQGAAETLERFRPYLIIEVQQDTARAAGYEAADILRLLRPLGYVFDIIGRNGRLHSVDESTLGRFQNVLCTPNGGNDRH